MVLAFRDVNCCRRGSCAGLWVRVRCWHGICVYFMVMVALHAKPEINLLASEANWDVTCDISEPNDNVIDGLDLEVFVGNWLEGL